MKGTRSGARLFRGGRGEVRFAAETSSNQLHSNKKEKVGAHGILHLHTNRAAKLVWKADMPIDKKFPIL